MEVLSHSKDDALFEPDDGLAEVKAGILEGFEELFLGFRGVADIDRRILGREGIGVLEGFEQEFIELLGRLVVVEYLASMHELAPAA